jgi:hypothetical protein
LVSDFQFGQGEVMTSFREREKAYEAEFAHREELKFKVRNWRFGRRNILANQAETARRMPKTLSRWTLQA